MMGPQKRRGPGSVGALPEAENNNHRIGNSTALTGYRALAGDPRVPFMDAMRVHEFQVEDMEADGSIHRVRIEGDRAAASATAGICCTPMASRMASSAIGRPANHGPGVIADTHSHHRSAAVCVRVGPKPNASATPSAK